MCKCDFCGWSRCQRVLHVFASWPKEAMTKRRALGSSLAEKKALGRCTELFAASPSQVAGKRSVTTQHVIDIACRQDVVLEWQGNNGLGRAVMGGCVGGLGNPLAVEASNEKSLTSGDVTPEGSSAEVVNSSRLPVKRLIHAFGDGIAAIEIGVPCSVAQKL